jgi:Rrf2 family protein
MRMSRSTGYGLLAINYIAKQKKDKLVMSNEISKKYNIPLEYLLKILQNLTRANILRSKRGPRGGFSLARHVSRISMLDILEAVEGPMNMSLGLDENAPKNDKFANKAEKAYAKILNQTKAAYKKVKISDLL